jgi:hypothetical protein
MAHRPAALPAPELVAPVYSAPVRGDAARLSWQPVDGATAYDVQVSPDEDFGRLIVEERVQGTALEVRQVLHGKSGEVYWRVASVGPYGAGAFGEPADFFSEAQRADAAYAGLRAEAHAQTPAEAASKQPNADEEVHFHSGKREFVVLIGAIVASTVLVIITMFAFEGLDGTDPEEAAAADTTQMAEVTDTTTVDADAATAVEVDSAAVPGLGTVGSDVIAVDADTLVEQDAVNGQ